MKEDIVWVGKYMREVEVNPVCTKILEIQRDPKSNWKTVQRCEKQLLWTPNKHEKLLSIM